MTLCFFYGSLRTGYWNQRVLSKNAKRLGLAKTVLPFGLYIGKVGTVPTCIPNEGTKSLVGDLYSLNASDARGVDCLEAGYESGLFDVIDENGQTHQAKIYHHNDPKDCSYIRSGYVLVSSGDYTKAVRPNGERIE